VIRELEESFASSEFGMGGFQGGTFHQSKMVISMGVPWGTPMDLMGFNEIEWDFHDDFNGIYDDFMGFHGIEWGFSGDLMLI